MIRMEAYIFVQERGCKSSVIGASDIMWLSQSKNHNICPILNCLLNWNGKQLSTEIIATTFLGTKYNGNDLSRLSEESRLMANEWLFLNSW